MTSRHSLIRGQLLHTQGLCTKKLQLVAYHSTAFAYHFTSLQALGASSSLSCAVIACAIWICYIRFQGAHGVQKVYPACTLHAQMVKIGLTWYQLLKNTDTE